MEFNSFDINVQVEENYPEEYEDWIKSLPNLLAEALERNKITDWLNSIGCINSISCNELRKALEFYKEAN